MAVLNTTSPAAVNGCDANASPRKQVPSSRVSSAGTGFMAVPPWRRPPPRPAQPTRAPPPRRPARTPSAARCRRAASRPPGRARRRRPCRRGWWSPRPCARPRPGPTTVPAGRRRPAAAGGPERRAAAAAATTATTRTAYAQFTGAPPWGSPDPSGSSPTRLPAANREGSPQQSVHHPTLYLTAMVWGVPRAAGERRRRHRPGGGRVEDGQVGGRAGDQRPAVAGQAAAAGGAGGQALDRLAEPKVAGLDQLGDGERQGCLQAEHARR